MERKITVSMGISAACSTTWTDESLLIAHPCPMGVQGSAAARSSGKKECPLRLARTTFWEGTAIDDGLRLSLIAVYANGLEACCRKVYCLCRCSMEIGHCGTLSSPYEICLLLLLPEPPMAMSIGSSRWWQQTS